MESGLIVMLAAHLKTQITVDGIRIFGDKKTMSIACRDTFHSFRGALRAFIQSVKQRKSVIPKEHVLTLVDWIERGM